MILYIVSLIFSLVVSVFVTLIISLIEGNVVDSLPVKLRIVLIKIKSYIKR